MRFSWWVVVVAVGCGGPVRKAGSCDGPCPASKIDHVVIVVQENHTFDSYYGRYCTAPVGSAPTCNAGPACCEAGPEHEPSGASPVALDDAANGGYDPNHNQDCELDELDGGKLDKFVTGTVCGDARNFAYATPEVVQPYWQLAAGGALADRFFQPIAGASASNDMYLARANFVFTDNDFIPDAIGKECSFIQTPMTEDTMKRRGDAIIAQIPFRRMGQPGEIAEMVVWLLSERASYVSGAAYNVDGGWMAA